MAFLAERFPDKISFGAVGGPGFLTDVVITNSGDEARDQVWQDERGEWDVSHAARLPVAYRPLQAFFRAAKGRANTFRFKDWSDFAVTAAEGKFVMLTSTTFQMVRRYTFGSQTVDRTIYLPVNATIAIVGGSSPSLATTGGVVTVSSGTPTGWSGEFDVHARFDTDKMKAVTIDRSGADLIIGWSSIPIVEVKGAP